MYDGGTCGFFMGQLLAINTHILLQMTAVKVA